MKKQSTTKPEASDLALFMANQVHTRRVKAGLTQAELARRSGTTVETIARIERILRGRASANANPSLDTLERIAGSLGCHAADLIDGRSAKSAPDPLVTMVRLAKPATRVWIAAMLEGCLRTEREQRTSANRETKSRRHA
jgi:transcriptional regulator with XRE-family HTH domain